MSSWLCMKSNSSLRALGGAAFAAMGLMGAGCGTTVLRVPMSYTAEQLPVAEKLPLRVGLLIPESTLDYQYHASSELVYQFGLNLPEVCRQTFLQVFDSVVFVQGRDYQAYDLIIEPSFDDAKTHVEALPLFIFSGAAHAVVGMTIEAGNASGMKWRESVVGDMTTGADGMFHGAAVSKAVAAAAAALRSELISSAARPRGGASETK